METIEKTPDGDAQESKTQDFVALTKEEVASVLSKFGIKD